uniref:Transcription factor TFIIIB component B'' homolog n=1 Tax=Phallusia mammillata TaxID=59560 RepID=A0A6F9D8A0_9ASCI|nr:transcription factor TFIIIB component B'' homolog [Phallusia mammillata]
MMRRRKNTFRPILPKSQTAAKGDATKEKEPTKGKDNDSAKEEPVQTQAQDELATKDIPSVENADLTNNDKSSETTGSVAIVSPEQVSTQPVSSKSPGQLVKEAQKESSSSITSTSDSATKKPSTKEPPKSRRRKLTAMPNTKRAAKPNLNKTVAKPSDSAPPPVFPVSAAPEVQRPQIAEETVQSVVVESKRTESTTTTDSVPKESPKNLVPSPTLTALTIPQPNVHGQTKLNLSPPTNIPHTMTVSIHRSPQPGSKLTHSHGRRPPNVVQATRVRHDSVRESAVKDKLNKQRAIDKLKVLQMREPDSEGKQWPTLDRNLISMSDLIYLNPPKTIGKELGLRAKLREVQELADKMETPIASPAPSQPEAENNPEVENEEDEPALVPQLRINEDGSVVIDEESLVVNSTPKSVETVNAAPAIYESGLASKVNTLSFRKRPAAKASRWSEKQTRKFFSALGIVGADFDLMSAMFRHRTRDELRRKYSIECRRNFAKIDDALRNQHLSKWTDEMFKPESSSEDESKPSRAKKQKKKHKAHLPPPQPVESHAELTLPVTVPENIPFDNSQSHDLLSTIIHQCEVVVDSSQACAS